MIPLNDPRLGTWTFRVTAWQRTRKRGRKSEKMIWGFGFPGKRIPYLKGHIKVTILKITYNPK